MTPTATIYLHPTMARNPFHARTVENRTGRIACLQGGDSQRPVRLLTAAEFRRAAERGEAESVHSQVTPTHKQDMVDALKGDTSPTGRRVPTIHDLPPYLRPRNPKIRARLEAQARKRHGHQPDNDGPLGAA